jgi:plasmid stabilization system protein ParE
LGFKIRISEPALADFGAILEYSAANFPFSAERFCNNLLNHIEILASFPYMGTPVRSRSNVRKIFHSPYTIYYRIQESRRLIEIVHFWHGSRPKPWL